MPEYVGEFRVPSRRNTETGHARLIGFELEFTGLSLDQAAEALSRSLGGRTRTKSVAEREIEVEGLGRFTIELDWGYLKRKASAQERDRDEEWVEFLAQAAALVVPMEVVCPPVPLDRIEAVNPVVDSLRDAGARGTEDSILAAYGVHINAEIPCLDAATLFSYVRAFAVLQWWLVEAHDVDISRRISPYIDLYPEAYLREVLRPFSGGLEDILAMYLEHNPSRNHALDLLPILAEIDVRRVRGAVGEQKVNARPAFHYRLPNCHVERPNWSLAREWNRWWVVEELAARPKDLERLGREFLDAERPLLGVKRSAWVEHVGRWLRDHALA